MLDERKKEEEEEALESIEKFVSNFKVEVEKENIKLRDRCRAIR